MKNPISFSNLNRQKSIANLGNSSFDLIIIGGGITGAGILLDAASRGLSVLLLEKNDFASGTSSKSTKLVHGGLRYLKQFDFWLVKEVGSERAIVHKLAPHLVQPEKMLLPLVENGSYGKWLTSIGLKVYDILAQVSDEDKRQMLSKEEALDKEPLLPEPILYGAGYYAEYRTDDARLTLENIKTSLQYGATALNYTNVTCFVYDDDKKINGIQFTDEITGKNHTVKSNYVINAAGPWVDELRLLNLQYRPIEKGLAPENNSSIQEQSRATHLNIGQVKPMFLGKRLHLTKGVHLVVPYHKLPVKQSCYFDIPDGRMMFAIPREGITYFGTTDTNFEKDKDDLKIDVTDAIYLITAVNNMFPTVHLELEDIISSWAGLRPLIHEEGKSPSDLSRKDEIFESDSGLISIAGGKLTGYRKMAERTVDRLFKNLEDSKGVEMVATTTDEIPLCGNQFSDYKDVLAYKLKITDAIKKVGLTDIDAAYLVHTYGKQTDLILASIDIEKQPDVFVALVLAEYKFCVDYEMIQTPIDYFVRRSGRLYFNIQSIKPLLVPVLAVHKELFKCTDIEIKDYENEIFGLIKKHSTFLNDA